MAAALIPRELASWGLTAVALGALEGGLLGVIVKNQFDGVAATPAVNLAVAVVAGAPSSTNLLSFLFAAHAAGRDKLEVLSRLMLVMGSCLAMLALVGISAPGLVAFCILTVIARSAWSGILTVRAAVWRANYDREWRGRVTGRIVQLSSLLVAASAAAIGWLLDWRAGAYRPAFVAGAACAVAAAFIYRNARVRRHRRLLAAERAPGAPGLNLSAFLAVLRHDADFRRYMAAMMVFGSGYLMIIPMLVVMLNEQLVVGQLEQVMITSSVPLLVLCVCIPFWARLLDRRHIFGYRAWHSWTYVASFGVFLLAMQSGWSALLWPASILLGAAYGGAQLGWNLGHHDFSTDARSSHYMAIHVTLTGLRGLLMPLAGVAFYELLSSHWPRQASLSLLLPLALSMAGSVWFVALHLERERRAASPPG